MSTPQSSRSLTTFAIILPILTIFLLALIPGLQTSTGNHHLVNAYISKIQRTFGIHHATAPTVSVPFLNTIKSRRSWYTLDKNIPVEPEKIDKIAEEAIQTIPSAFNSQFNRAVVLHGSEHDKLWNIVTSTLKPRIDADQWAATNHKLDLFKAAAGTILFFVDTSVVQHYVETIPTYALQFPDWATQSSGMLQHTVWTALHAEGLGANLQHYNPLIDEAVLEAWGLSVDWKLSAQLVFGGRVGGTPERKSKKPLEEVMRVYGA